MIKDYSYRSYHDGDANEINRLYELVTGNTRTQQQFEWQWLEAPGGQAEIWLIEAIHENGQKELIGHHGIMPIRFSLGSKDLLFGKTENTLVRPEFRRKILYPRFEKRFLSHYERRFDALFSTIGPPAALRQRRALGYEYRSRFVNFKFRTGVASEVAYLRSRLDRVISRQNRKAGHLPYGFDVDQWHLEEARDSNLRLLDDAAAARDSFFDGFWGDVRNRFGLTPSRNAEDLQWRFWKNPYKKHVVLVSDSAGYDPGYVVLSRSVADPNSADIEDIVPCDPNPDCFARLLGSVIRALRNSPIRWLSFWTTDEWCPPADAAGGLAKYRLRACELEQKIRPLPDRRMPRRLTPRGLENGVDPSDWYVTPFVFQGRVAV